MHIKENEEVMIFKSDKGYYSIGMSRKDRNNQFYHGYLPCMLKNGLSVENKTRIKIKEAFISFYIKDDKTIPYVMILSFEELGEKENYAKLKGDVDIDSKELPF